MGIAFFPVKSWSDIVVIMYINFFLWHLQQNQSASQSQAQSQQLSIQQQGQAPQPKEIDESLKLRLHQVIFNTCTLLACQSVYLWVTHIRSKKLELAALMASAWCYCMTLMIDEVKHYDKYWWFRVNLPMVDHANHHFWTGLEIDSQVTNHDCISYLFPV